MATMTTTYGSKVGSVWRAYTSGSYTTSDTKYEFSIIGGINIPNDGYKTSRKFTSTIYVGSTSLGSATWNDSYANKYGVLTQSIKTASYTVTRTHVAQTVTFKSILSGSGESTTSTATLASVTVPAKSSWTVSYNANGGSGAPGNQTKWYGETLTLSSSIPTRTNYTFLGWATSQTNANNGTVTYQKGGSYTANSGITLYAVWKQNYSLPTITNLNAVRCNDTSGTVTEDSETNGTFIKLSFSYTGGSLDGGNSYVTPTCTVTIDGDEVDSPTMSTSGPITMVYGNNWNGGQTYIVDSSHTINVKLFDTNNTTGITKTATVGAATFPIDILGDGSAMGLMTPAVANQFITVPSLVSTGTIISTKDGVDTSAGMLVSHGIANRDSGFTAKRTDTNTAVSLIVGTGGVNHGVWSHKQNQWLIYGDASNIYLSKAPIFAGHTTAIGSIIDAYLSTSTNVSSGTYTSLCSISVPIGTWVFVLGVRFPNNATGYREAYFEPNTNGATNITVNAVSGISTQLSFTKIVSVSSVTTYYLGCRQNSGSQLTMPATGAGYGTFIRGVRIA